MAREYKDVIVGLDIGTAKVMAVVAEVMYNGELKLAGLGVAPSNGLKRGVVVNYHYADGKDYQPSDAEVRRLRPAAAQ